MKKFIQICSLLSLVFAITAVSASAQTAYGSEVEIPFSFNVDSRSYDAGKYIVKLSKLESGTGILTIGDPKNDSVQTVIARRNGETANGEVKLVFETVNGERVLNRIVTPSGGFALNRSRPSRDAVGLNRNRGSRPADAAVVGITNLF